MTYNWQPGVQYDQGSIVNHKGLTYIIIQPHRSQSDWEPQVTPALWRVLESNPGDQSNYGGMAGVPVTCPFVTNNVQQGHQFQQVNPPQQQSQKPQKDDHHHSKIGHFLAGTAVGAGLLAAGNKVKDKLTGRRKSDSD